MLESITTESDAEYFVKKTSAAVMEGKTFRFFEYYLLWLGSRVIIKHPPQDLRVWDAMVGKIAACQNLTDNEEINGVDATMGIALMSVCFPYRGPSPMENGPVDWKRWTEMEKWYRANRERFQFSAEAGKFNLVHRVQE